ncbi:endonuclease NucS [Streptomyces] [Streptomyces griseus]
MSRYGDGKTVAIEVKRRGEIDGVEQLTRYLELLNPRPAPAPVQGVFAAT